MPADKVSRELLSALQASPTAEFLLLVRTTQADDEAERTLHQLGMTIRQRLTLVPTFAVTASGAAAIELLNQPWVVRVEEDRPVHTM